MWNHNETTYVYANGNYTLYKYCKQVMYNELNFDLFEFIVLHLGGSMVLYPLTEVVVTSYEGVLLCQGCTLLQKGGNGGKERDREGGEGEREEKEGGRRRREREKNGWKERKGAEERMPRQG